MYKVTIITVGHNCQSTCIGEYETRADIEHFFKSIDDFIPTDQFCPTMLDLLPATKGEYSSQTVYYSRPDRKGIARDIKCSIYIACIS